MGDAEPLPVGHLLLGCCGQRVPHNPLVCGLLQFCATDSRRYYVTCVPHSMGVKISGTGAWVRVYVCSVPVPVASQLLHEAHHAGCCSM